MRQTVLLVEDHPATQELVAAWLRTLDVDVICVGSGGDCLRAAHHRVPDLVLLDLGLPDQHGFEVCAALKSSAATEQVPVVFLSAKADVTAKVRGFELGAVDYVTKPFDSAEMLARVRAALRAKRYQDMLSTRAQVDALTGLKNRAYFEQRLGDEMAASRRYGRDVCLVLADMDHFKRVNDERGHPAGDELLRRAGELVTGTVRSTDAACRYGGEEFAVILTETGEAGGAILAERLRRGIERIEISGLETVVHVTASFGVASTEGTVGEPMTALTLVKRADDALYRAKRGGRDRVCRWSAA